MPPPRSSGRPPGPPAATPSTAPSARLVQPIGQSLAADDGLAHLLARVRASQERLEAVADTLPPSLRPHLRSGPLDDEGWTILAANAAVAAKLRQLLPLLSERLAEKGWEATSIRVRVQH